MGMRKTEVRMPQSDKKLLAFEFEFSFTLTKRIVKFIWNVLKHCICKAIKQYLNVEQIATLVHLTLVTVCLRPHKKAKESDPGHLGHLFYILCGHFDEKKPGVPPKMGVGWAVKVRR